MARVLETTSKKPAGGSASTPATTLAAVPEPTAVAARAYELWQQSGCAHGRDQEHWFQAERELRTRKSAR